MACFSLLKFKIEKESIWVVGASSKNNGKIYKSQTIQYRYILLHRKNIKLIEKFQSSTKPFGMLQKKQPKNSIKLNKILVYCWAECGKFCLAVLFIPKECFDRCLFELDSLSQRV
ncbi:hypothetical protein BpHYR1_020253 [Brachionus plicatilis]|uniref:Uncharacterized protein n=1 Tax=Brachionus plicatilis TaxID=10195 RepID=A0A3M7QJN8_BRAPC|nr:hypothetical protein BpHYR1_020253 [Brachionus plicatilis]